MIGISAAVGVVFLVLIFQMASAPSYSTLMTGLDPAQTGKITSTLDTKGITYQLQNNGTALAVQSDKTAQARVALATAGLLSSTQQQGFSLFDKQQLGSSNFQQQITYQRALEGQLATTIQSIQGVSSAQVQLVLPDPQAQLFSDNAQPSTAAVLISGSTSLDPGAVKGIAQLVASSVPNLHSDKVTITDASGQLLWPTADAVGAGGTSLLAKQAAQAQYDASTEARVNAMLTQTLGAGKSQVQVNADLDANQANADALTYKGKGIPLVQHSQTEALKGAGGAAGPAGTAGNIPAYAQTGSGNSNYSNKITDSTMGVDKTVTHTVVAPGNVNRQTVSVLIDKTVPAAEIPALKTAVTNAVGLNTKRGDTLSIGQMVFAKPTVPVAATKSPMMSYAKYGAVALFSLLFLGFVARLLKRRENESFMSGQPTWLRELESPRPLAALELAEAPPQAAVMQLQAQVNPAKRQIEDLVERNPDRVAQQVRAWMAED